MYSKTCPIPVKNVRDKLIEMTPLSSLLSDCTADILKRQSWPYVAFIDRSKEYSTTTGWERFIHILVNKLWYWLKTL